MNYYLKRIYNKAHKILSIFAPFSVNRSVHRLEKLIASEDNFKILFVCTGNICRSAFSDAYLKSKISNGKITIASAGIHTNDNLPANDKAIEIAKEFNVDLSTHKTQTIKEALKNPQNLFFVFEPIHTLYLRRYHKVDRKMIFYLGHFSKPPKTHIQDPYGRSNEIFKNVFVEIIKACDELAKSLGKFNNSL